MYVIKEVLLETIAGRGLDNEDEGPEAGATFDHSSANMTADCGGSGGKFSDGWGTDAQFGDCVRGELGGAIAGAAGGFLGIALGFIGGGIAGGCLKK